jgi:hypothetical protein
MVILAGDTGQLEAVDAGGIFRLIAARHGHWKLTEVRRFRLAWERDASLRLRDGDTAVLAEYDARGRIYHGPLDRVYDDAVTLQVNDILAGRDSLLVTTSNETAARLAALVRERLAGFGLVGPAEITLADGNPAGRGDLVRARLNTRIEADGQTLANRDTIRIEGLAGTGPGFLAVVTRRTAAGEWSKPFFVPVAYLQESAELDYAGNVHVAEGRTVDAGHALIEPGASRAQVYTASTRGREKNTIHVVTGPPDPAQPSRAEREAYTAAAIKQAAELRRQGDVAGARAVPLQMPDRPSNRQLAPWEAVLAQALQQDEPERAALEEMQAAQTSATNTGYLLQLSEAFWRLDVVPQIDQMVRERIGPREYERYLQDPERPALLQALRAHEIGGRRIEDSLDAITAEPLTGLRSIAAGLHGRLGKEPPPARGETRNWAERAPQDAPEPIREAARMLDTRQAELGRQLAERPPEWALQAWGVPPAEPGALRDDWERRAAIVESYREAAGITNPAQAIGPVPSGRAQLREAFHASVVALELPDDQALLRAQGRGELEGRIAAHDRALAAAPRDVQPEIGQRERDWQGAQARAHAARYEMDAEAAAEAEAEAQEAAADLARLAVADAARREWAEAHAGKAEAARDAEAELRRRDQADRVAQTDKPAPEHHVETDAEFRAMLDRMVAEAEGREWVPTPTPEPEPQPELLSEAEFRAKLDRMVADAEARAVAAETAEPEAMPGSQAEAEPGRTAELVSTGDAGAGHERQVEAEPATAAVEPVGPERERFVEDMAEIQDTVAAIDAEVERMPDAEAERRAEVEAAGINEPVMHEPQAEPELESAWQPGTDSGQYEAAADAEAEIEM